jgi:hypothetical protein
MYWLKKNLMTLVLDWQQTPRGHICSLFSVGWQKVNLCWYKIVKVTALQK